MIYYASTDLVGIFFRWKGSAFNGPAPLRALCIALVALAIALLHARFNFVVRTTESTAFVDTLTVFNTFIGLTVSFRLNSAFQQWRAGVLAVGTMAEASRGLVSSAGAFLSARGPTEEPLAAPSSASSQALPRETLEKWSFLLELRRLVLAYITIVFLDCRGRDGIESMRDASVLTQSESQELQSCCDHAASAAPASPHKQRAAVVELWLKRAVEVAAARELLSASHASALQTKIAQLPSLYTAVFHIANIPIPFNYMQYLQYLIAVYMTLYTFVIVPRSGLYTPLWVFFWGMFLFTADQVAMEIECPFGTDANDIDLEDRLSRLERELTVIVRSQYYFFTGGKELPHETTPQLRAAKTLQAAQDLQKRQSLNSFHSNHVLSDELEAPEAIAVVDECMKLMAADTAPPRDYGSTSRRRSPTSDAAAFA
ncbi:hypothetical protein P43SY_007915 [Pythium insidiosum]|uniref:Uncharacterized protein n=1 Tax=Pythium insidiosum TaxID=114742 RepID=A0AAD5LNI8_PYTIN|nr:hypothetical protein P43SY_007915 [Pythium insidiosum]